MNVHKNARLTPRGREVLISRLKRGEHPQDVAKAVGWFKEGDLDARLPEGVKDFLTAASVSFQAEVHAMKLAARKLGPNAAA